MNLLYDSPYFFLYESIFIGFYSLVLYSILQMVILDSSAYPFLLFVLGIAKHLLGYVVGLQSIYCQIHNNHTISQIAIIPTALDLIIEGLLYLGIGLGLFTIVKNKYIIAFLIGLVLHIGFELLGLHDYFLRTRCINHL